MPNRLRVLLLKPAHYDDDGYVIQWRRAFMPVHVLAVVRGIIDAAARRGVPEPGVQVETRAVDESSSVISTQDLIGWLREADRGLVMMVGVQTNQVPRAVDLGRDFTEAGFPVATGGFHVSGCMAMVPDWEPSFAALRAAGHILFAGEFEETADGFLQDAWHGRLKPVYNVLSTTTDMARAPLPDIATNLESHTIRPVAGLDVGRGCPFVCSFCTVINVHGRKMRQREVSDLRGHLIALHGQGVRELLVVDDNFARNPRWRDMFAMLIDLRETRGIAFELFIQIDTQAHRIPDFVRLAAEAGCLRAYIGVETLNVANLGAAGKPQNRNLDRVKEGVMAWKRAGVLTICSYIVGFPEDTPESVRHDMEYLKRELPFDLFYVYMLTPLPGSEDHKRAVAAGVALDADLNRYDAQHAVMDHPVMSAEEWTRLYHDMVDWYYTPEHIQTLFSRAMAHGISTKDLFVFIAAIYGSYKIQGLHPLEGGVIRRKNRHVRRPGLPVEPAWRFYPRRVRDVALAMARYCGLYARLGAIFARAWLAWHAGKSQKTPDTAMVTTEIVRAR